MIGRYRLMEKIGEGGFGQVYVAEQQQPVRRRVALKLLKPGMDSREVIARFEAERQALAMMDHRHIATVFDAGEDAAGQPYFVMELVPGVPITRFCDQRRLTTRERLRLFIDVCQAVQHAHQKGIIHRDLKPSNVLVTLHDGVAVAKVIDFGVAKAISEPLTSKTLYTRFAQMIGTPLYMSPEQAEMSGLDVDTRSDIYSLGVLLYELLTGTTPFDQQRLQAAAFDELRRIIREDEPLRPSARLSTSAPALSTAAVNQQTDTRLLRTTLRGDLDWIVMKALEKDRRRRYETAADFARDLQRYLDQQPVIARPPSPWYRFSKFARRNKVVLTTASLVLIALIAGTVVSTWQAVRATRARAEADRLRQEAVDFADRLKESNVLLDSARANADEQRWSLAYRQYTKAAELQPEHYLVWSGRASLYLRLGLWKQAAADFASALELGAPANNPGWWGVPQLCLYAGDQRAYRRVCTEMLQQLERTQDGLFTAIALRSCLLSPDPVGDSEDLLRRAEQLSVASSPMPPRRKPPGDMPPGTGAPQGPPGGSLGPPPLDFGGPFGSLPPQQLNHYVAGLAHYRAGDARRAIERLRQAVGFDPRWPTRAVAEPVLAMACFRQGHVEEARMALQQTETTLDQWTSQLATSAVGQAPVPWFDFLECLLLYREAFTLITGLELPDDPRLEQLEQRALNTLTPLNGLSSSTE
jgi:eukaryotic-like serine/threonine-protein kinase